MKDDVKVAIVSQLAGLSAAAARAGLAAAGDVVHRALERDPVR